MKGFVCRWQDAAGSSTFNLFVLQRVFFATLQVFIACFPFCMLHCSMEVQCLQAATQQSPSLLAQTSKAVAVRAVDRSCFLNWQQHHKITFLIFGIR